MNKPIVAVVGRPNVGKSTFFNRIAGRRISIVEDTPGVTRDRIYTDVDWLDHNFTLVDTGGIEPLSNDVILSQMREQSRMAIETADVVLFMVDAREGITQTDYEVAEMLRKTRKPVLLVCNKVDNTRLETNIYEFYNLGLGNPIPISAEQGLGIGDLLDLIVKHFSERGYQDYDEDTIKVAITGKPNVGKSSLLNKLLGEDRVIVGDLPGTTRDAIDTVFTLEEKKYVLIDTAGIRKRSRVEEAVERYSVIRALSAVSRSDVCLLIIDAVSGPTEQDTKIAGYIHNEGKGCIIVVNKWDLIEKDNRTVKEYTKDIRNKLPFISYAPIQFISAKTGQRVNKLLEMVNHVYEQSSQRLTTGLLNDILGEAVLMNQPPSDKGKRLKVFYITQVSVKPPTFVLFVNDKALMHFSYLRYLENQYRDSFGFEGTPVRFIVRERGSRGGI